MLTKSDFTAEDWSVIRRAPFMAGLVVVAASPSGPFGVIKEMFAVGKTLADVKLHGASSDLVKAVVADLETAEARQQSMPAELQGKTPDEVRTAALDACRQASSAAVRTSSGVFPWSSAGMLCCRASAVSRSATTAFTRSLEAPWSFTSASVLPTANISLMTPNGPLGLAATTTSPAMKGARRITLQSSAVKSLLVSI